MISVQEKRGSSAVTWYQAQRLQGRKRAARIAWRAGACGPAVVRQGGMD